MTSRSRLGRCHVLVVRARDIECVTVATYAFVMGWRLLDDVPAEDVRMLLSVARRRRFERGEIVFHRDDPGESLHLIVSCRFAVRVMTPVGDTVWLAVRGPGESFGEMTLIESDARRSLAS